MAEPRVLWSDRLKRRHERSTGSTGVAGTGRWTKRCAGWLRENPWYALSFVVVALLAAVPLCTASRIGHPLDDVYITLSYARSIAQGHAFKIFPTAPATLGTTSPLSALIFAVPALVAPGVDLGPVAVWFSALAWIATGFTWLAKGTSLGLSRLESFVVAAVVTVAIPGWYLLGFEQELLFLLLTFAVVCWSEGRALASGILLGLATLTRGEAILMLAACAANELAGFGTASDERIGSPLRSRVKGLSLGLLPILLLAGLYARIATGSFLPATLTAKIAQVAVQHTHEPFLVGLARVLREDWSTLPILTMGVFGVSLWLVLAAVGFAFALSRRRALMPFALWAGLYAAGYGLINVPFYPWYSAGVQYVITVFAALALAVPASLVSAGENHGRRRLELVAVFLATGLVVKSVAAKVVPATRVEGVYHGDYVKLARFIDENTPEKSRIGYYELGYLSWYSHRHIVDLLGLTDRTLLPQLFVQPDSLLPVFEKANVDYFIDSRRLPNGQSIRESKSFMTYFSRIASVQGEDEEYGIWRRYPDGRLPERRTVQFDATLHGTGWWDPERTTAGTAFRWIRGVEATVEVPSLPGAHLSVVLHVLQEIIPGLARTARVTVDGVPFALSPLPADAVPPIVLCGDGIVAGSAGGKAHTIEISVPRSARPVDLRQGNPDERPLGLALDWVEMRPSGEACAR